MKYIANHTLIFGKGASAREILAGDALPKLPADEIQRLIDLQAVTGLDDGTPGPTPAEVAAAARVAADKAAAEKAAADKAAADKAEAERLAAQGRPS